MRKDQRLTTSGAGIPSEEIAVGEFSMSSWAGLQDQTVFPLCSDELNSWKDTSLLEESK